MGLFSRKVRTNQSVSTSTQQTEVQRGTSINPLHARLQLMTGKGGVGKTTTALTLAQAFAQRGEKVLLLEARDAEDELVDDPTGKARQDSMLGRAIALALDGSNEPPRQLSATPVLIKEHLWAAQLVATVGHAAFLRSIIPSDRLVKAALESKPLSKFLRSAPSMHELGLFYHLKGFEEDENYQKIVIDMPATGHTLALSQLPEKISKIIKKGQIVSALKAGVDHIANPKNTSLWVVTLPETLPISEALEVATALTADGIEPQGIICNRCLDRELNPQEENLLNEVVKNTQFSMRSSRQDEVDDQIHLDELIYTLITKFNPVEADQKKLEHFKKQLRLPEILSNQQRVAYIIQYWPFGEEA